MTENEIKNRIAALSALRLSGLIAENWAVAQTALRRISDGSYRETAVELYPLQFLCLIIAEKQGFNECNSAEKELIVEKMKSVLAPVVAMLRSDTKMLLPTYLLTEGLIPKDGEQSFFAEQLKEDFMWLGRDEANALALTLYAVVYAFYGHFEDGAIALSLGRLLDASHDIATNEVYASPHTQSVPTASGGYRSTRVYGEWLPLKIYLIATTLFVALVFGFVLFSMSADVGASSMSIMNTSGHMVSIEPDMEPVTLFLFGTVDYDELIAGIKTSAIIFIVWRVVLITAVYIINARLRRSC